MLFIIILKVSKYKTWNEMTNVHGEILEILCNFMERVHDSGKVP